MSNTLNAAPVADKRFTITLYEDSDEPRFYARLSDAPDWGQVTALRLRECQCECVDRERPHHESYRGRSADGFLVQACLDATSIGDFWLVSVGSTTVDERELETMAPDPYEAALAYCLNAAVRRMRHG